MSTDVERIVQGCRQVHEVWANAVQVIFATWILERELGVACIAPVGICAGEINPLFSTQNTVLTQ